MRRRRGGPRRAALRRPLLLTVLALALLFRGELLDTARELAARAAGFRQPPTAAESAPPLEERRDDRAGYVPESAPPPVPDTSPAPEETSYEAEIRNETAYVLDPTDMEPSPIGLIPDGTPRVLIVHTHTSEAYLPDEAYYYVPDDNDRTLDPAFNVTAVGDRIETLLTAAGIGVIHDRTINDYPSYSGSYSRMLRVIEENMAAYPEIRVVLDVHRDALYEPDGSRFAPRTEIEGRTAARVMLVVGTDEGVLPHEKWRENLAFALSVQRAADVRYPGLMRPVDLRSSRFNQHVSPGALIVEVGSSGNTLGEALYGAELFAEALLDVLTQAPQGL